MAVDHDADRMEEDEYDEEADSDFDDHQPVDDGASSTSDDETGISAVSKPSHSGITKDQRGVKVTIDLDSGDEATIKEQEKTKRRQRRKGEDVDAESETEGWQAQTRAMRQRDQVEKKKNRLATSKGSTVDVDKIWEEMNRPGPLPPVRVEGVEESAEKPVSVQPMKQDGSNKENIPAGEAEELITIKRRFKFAGEIHVEEKVVPKSSAEARLWLTQQENKSQSQPDVEGEKPVQRPLRKISRFDPNYNNLSAFKTNWTRGVDGEAEQFKGPKLNVVEKSKMDWAVHVDAEGLKDELDVHAKAKEGYHSRMDFLMNVEQRKEEEARLVRTKK